MSTRATIHFQDDGQDVAIVYRHGDGYPMGLGKDLKEFFKEVSRQTKDTRFNDASYLAAKWVVWDSDQVKRGLERVNILDFIGVGIVMEDPADIRYRYLVNCTNDKPPKIKIETTPDLPSASSRY